MNVRKHFSFFLVFVFLIAWIFSGWPQIWHNPSIPPQPTHVLALTTSAKYAGTATDGGDNAGCSWVSPSNATGDTTSTSSDCDMAGNNTDTNELELTNFGFTASDVPAASQIDGITVEVEYNTEVANSNDLTVSLTRDGSTIISGSDNKGTGTTGRTTKVIVSYGGASDTWMASPTQADVTSSNFGVILRYNKGQSGGKVNASVYRVRMTIDYTLNAAANAPSQDAPADSATGVSVTPNFLMTTTDPDSDDLSYKVTIYSNSACTTVVSTHDQSVTQTGWTGTDATCTASPTSCYASGTQANFTLQSGDALSESTQYWWEASAKDPDGLGTFTDSATCNTFTTGASASLTLIVTTDDFPALTPGSPVFATSTISVDTDNAGGWEVSVYGNNKTSTDNVLCLAGVCADGEIPDPTNEWSVDAAQATTSGGNAASITSGDDFLYFRVMSASGSQPFLSTGWWGTSDTNFNASQLWAGIPSTTNVSRIGDTNVDTGGSAALNTVQYYVDVSNSQLTGTYTGDVIYTAIMN